MSAPRHPRFAVGFAPVIATVLLALSAGASARAEAGWGDYVNVRFQYRLCYPKAMFAPRAEADNGDGLRFAADPPTSLIVYGRNNALDETTKALAAEAGARLAGEGGKITYSQVRPSGFAVSGTQGNQIFYARGLLKNDQFKIFELNYPAAQAVKFKAVVEKLSTCFANVGG